MFKNKKAFTLGEVLIVLALCGILAAMLLPAIANVRPDKKKVMFKKAYYIAERMVYELVNDDDFYPEQGDLVGLNNTILATYLGESYEGNTKFCQLFAHKVNNADNEIHCDATHATPAGGGNYTEPSFVTTDGLAWYVPISNFATTQTIYVDVNTNEAPNCKYNATSCHKPDIFEIKVAADGKMNVSGTREKEYLKSSNTR